MINNNENYIELIGEVIEEPVSTPLFGGGYFVKFIAAKNPYQGLFSKKELYYRVFINKEILNEMNKKLHKGDKLIIDGSVVGDHFNSHTVIANFVKPAKKEWGVDCTIKISGKVSCIFRNAIMNAVGIDQKIKYENGKIEKNYFFVCDKENKFPALKNANVGDVIISEGFPRVLPEYPNKIRVAVRPTKCEIIEQKNEVNKNEVNKGEELNSNIENYKYY